MARLFDDGSSEYLTTSVAHNGIEPLTLACWVNSDTIEIEQVLLCVINFTSGVGEGDFHLISLRGDKEGDVIYAASFDGIGGAVQAETTSGYSANTWHHICGVFSANNARAAYLDGGNKGTESTTKAIENIDRTAIGTLDRNDAPSTFTSGSIAEPTIWNAALTDAEIAILATGISAWQIRPQNLVFYPDLIRDLNDKAGGLVLTASGTVVSPHPRIIEEGSTRGIWAISAPPGISIPVIMKHLREQRIA